MPYTEINAPGFEVPFDVEYSIEGDELVLEDATLTGGEGETIVASDGIFDLYVKQGDKFITVWAYLEAKLQEKAEELLQQGKDAIAEERAGR